MSPMRQHSKFSEPLTAELGKNRFPPFFGGVIGFAAGLAASFVLASVPLYVVLPLACGAIGLFLSFAREKIHYQKEIIKHLQSQLLQRAVIDETTDLYNHDFFLKEAAREMERSKRYGRMLSALLVDVKGFRKINDEHGNVAADGALRAVAEVLSKSVRRVDTLGRYGGDEFLVLLPGAKPSNAEKVGDRIRNSVSSKSFTHEGKAIPLEVLIRVLPCGTIPELDVFDLIARADQAIAEMRSGGTAPAPTPA